MDLIKEAKDKIKRGRPFKKAGMDLHASLPKQETVIKLLTLPLTEDGLYFSVKALALKNGFMKENVFIKNTEEWLFETIDKLSDKAKVENKVCKGCGVMPIYETVNKIIEKLEK